MNHRSIFKLLAVVLLLGLAACSGGQSKGPVEVQVTATDFAFQSSLTTFEVGVPYHFVVTNNGQTEHEFMIVKPIPAGSMDMEEMDQMAIGHIEEDDLQPGGTASVDVTFTEPAPEGTLEMSCHLPGHYENGMLLPITVK